MRARGRQDPPERRGRRLPGEGTPGAVLGGEVGAAGGHPGAAEEVAEAVGFAERDDEKRDSGKDCLA